MVSQPGQGQSHQAQRHQNSSPTAVAVCSDRLQTGRVLFHEHKTVSATEVSMLRVREYVRVWSHNFTTEHHLRAIQATTGNIVVRQLIVHGEVWLSAYFNLRNILTY